MSACSGSGGYDSIATSCRRRGDELARWAKHQREVADGIAARMGLSPFDSHQAEPTRLHYAEQAEALEAQAGVWYGRARLAAEGTLVPDPTDLEWREMAWPMSDGWPRAE